MSNTQKAFLWGIAVLAGILIGLNWKSIFGTTASGRYSALCPTRKGKPCCEPKQWMFNNDLQDYVCQ